MNFPSGIVRPVGSIFVAGYYLLAERQRQKLGLIGKSVPRSLLDDMIIRLEEEETNDLALFLAEV